MAAAVVVVTFAIGLAAAAIAPVVAAAVVAVAAAAVVVAAATVVIVVAAAAAVVATCFLRLKPQKARILKFRQCVNANVGTRIEINKTTLVIFKACGKFPVFEQLKLVQSKAFIKLFQSDLSKSFRWLEGQNYSTSFY